MPSKRTTTVVLTEKSRKIKDRLGPGLGLKGILSVGLELFDKLGNAQKIKRVGIAIIADKKSKAKPPIVLKSLADVVAISQISMEARPDFVLGKELQEWASQIKAGKVVKSVVVRSKGEKQKKIPPDPLKAG